MRIGILGKGQLGHLLAAAADCLGDSCCFYEQAQDRFTPSVHCSAEEVLTGPDAFSQFIACSDVITFETENTDNDLGKRIAAEKPFYPPISILALASDRWEEKRTFEALDIPTSAFVCVSGPSDLPKAAALGFPFVLKTATEGYDGKGQTVVRSQEDLAALTLTEGLRYLAEAWVEYQRELSIIGARTASGDVVFYPMGENMHTQGILQTCYVSASVVTAEMQAAGEALLQRLMTHVDYVGVMALELFETPEGTLLANECAPRVHNTGHWTIEGAKTSQFENHLRAITGRPLGATDLLTPAIAMGNIIGQMPEAQPSETNLFWHDYEKSPARPGRKLGHVTILGEGKEVLETLEQLSIVPILS